MSSEGAWIVGRADEPVGELVDEAGEHDQIGAGEFRRRHVDRGHHREIDIASDQRLLRQRAFQIQRLDVEAVLIEELSFLGDPEHRDVDRRRSESRAQSRHLRVTRENCKQKRKIRRR